MNAQKGNRIIHYRDDPNVIAIKESSGNLEKVMQLLRVVKPGFQVLVGSAPTLWPSFTVGAVGAVLAFSNAAPAIDRGSCATAAVVSTANTNR